MEESLVKVGVEAWYLSIKTVNKDEHNGLFINVVEIHVDKRV